MIIFGPNLIFGPTSIVIVKESHKRKAFLYQGEHLRKEDQNEVGCKRGGGQIVFNNICFI